jgi:very-short-patch-repair endonuclease
MSKRLYNTNNKANSKILKSNMTLPERILWFQILAKDRLGVRFSRQIKIGNYIVDFCCLKSKLVIELDGLTHDNLSLKDKVRDDFLVELGYKVVRIQNDDVLNNLDGVDEYLKAVVGVKLL